MKEEVRERKDFCLFLLIIIIDDDNPNYKTFFAHKIILSQFSYFRAMFSR